MRLFARRTQLVARNRPVVIRVDGIEVFRHARCMSLGFVAADRAIAVGRGLPST
jgi:hypothetical protein